MIDSSSGINSKSSVTLSLTTATQGNEEPEPNTGTNGVKPIRHDKTDTKDAKNQESKSVPKLVHSEKESKIVGSLMN